jgi:hypothetical protein
MSPVLYLRVASILALVQAAGHWTSVIRWAATRGQDQLAVIDVMKAHTFNFQGFARSYWDLFFGYGLMAALPCVVEGVLFWQLASLTRGSDFRGAPIVALFIAANIAHAVLCWNYFFLTPIVLDVTIALCLSLALFSLTPLVES